MRVTFTKASERNPWPVWVGQAGKRRIEGSIAGSEPRRLPHDVVTFVIERELGIADGFFGTVAAGGTFRSMAKRKTKPGRQAIARNVPTIDAAEKVVNRTRSDWLAGRPTPCNAALDRAHAAWMALPPGFSLTLDWLPCPAHPASPKKRHRRR